MFYRVTGALVDQRVLADLITKHLPDLAKDVDVTLLVNLSAMSWFMAIFLTVLPFHKAVRIVDWFLLDGARSLFQIRSGLLYSPVIFFGFVLLLHSRPCYFAGFMLKQEFITKRT